MQTRLDTRDFSVSLDNKPDMRMDDMELKRQQIEEEILLQIKNNQKILHGLKVSWDRKVSMDFRYILAKNKILKKTIFCQ